MNRRILRFRYPDSASLREKIEAVATKVYGADGVSYSTQATSQLDTYERAGFGRLPVCIAKTHLSISSDPSLKGAPTGWTLPVREVRASVGAGFAYPICLAAGLVAMAAVLGGPAARGQRSDNPNLRGDAVTGAVLAAASARSAASLVDINVGLGGLEPELSRRAAQAVTDACRAADRVTARRGGR